MDPDLLADAGHLGGDLPDPGHSDGQALNEGGVDTRLKTIHTNVKKNTFEEKKRTLTPPIWNFLVNLMAHIVCLAQKSIRSGVKQ